MAIWTPTQKTKTKKLKAEGCKRSYEVEVPYSRLQEAVDNVYLRLQLQARLPGFRPGKAPLDLIKKQYGPAAQSEAAEQVIKRVIPEVLKELELRPVAMPEVGGLHLHPEKPMKFELHVEVAPDFKPSGYKGIKIVRKEYAVEDKHVEARLKSLQEGNARLEKAEAEAVAGEHYVVLDYELYRDGKKIEGGSGKRELIDMSSDQTIDGLIEGLKGMERGESKEVEVKIDGKPAVCKVSVEEIKTKILPALDDEFAKDMGLESLEKLKSELKSIIEKEAAEKSDREVSAQIEKALIEANAFDLPPSLVEHQLEHMYERFVARVAGRGKALPEKQAEELKEKMRPQALDQVRLQFVLSAIAQAEKIETDDQDLADELEKTLASQPEEKDKQKARKFFESNKDDIRAALKERKVIQLIRDSAKEKKEKAVL